MYYYQLSSLRAATIYAFHIAPSVRRCEELARQAKPPAPPSLQTLGQQGRWGRRFRLPGRPEANFSQRLSAGTGCGRNRPLADAWGYLAASRDWMRNMFSTVQPPFRQLRLD